MTIRKPVPDSGNSKSWKAGMRWSRYFRRGIDKHCLSKEVYLDAKTASLRVLGNVITGHFKAGATYKCEYCYGWHITRKVQ